MAKCKTEECWNMVENRDTGLCASCGAAIRKADRQGFKNDMKRLAQKPIKKISDKRKKETGKYVAEAALFVRGKTCAVFPHLKATECHHVKGRQGYADEWAQQRGITLLMDKRYWLAVSSEGHRKITEDSAFAFEKGFSILRSN